MIGGGGERKTLRLVATYADACNIIGPPTELAHKIEVLRRHCDEVGRDISEIEITTMLRDRHPTADEILRSAEDFAALGVATLVTSPIGDDPAAALEATYGPVIDRLAAVRPARL
jgi:alkanesulfonate monooxygenase SsuD/methylene tetrahydromethanopterin reductase-like flavin-dependent oxidoreductase (luciferase family)